MTANQEHFHAILKAELAPRLRAAGFKGSGQNFRRVTGEIIHAINIQGNKWGGSCIVNLGVHVIHLPTGIGEFPDPWSFKVIDCEFHSRIGDRSTSDGWWHYGDSDVEAESSARSLVQTYFDKGETYFQHYGTVPVILAALACKVANTPEAPSVLGGIGGGPVRVALAAARLHRHRGEIAESRRFAQIGLGGIRNGVGIALKEELETLAGQP